jgi:serine/threonine protein kinase
MLLSHGSYYLGITDQEAFYGADAAYVAPEVLHQGSIDDRCDVYSLGRFMQSLFEKASMPMEYKLAIKKACSESPEDRFNTPAEMLKSVEKRRGTFKSIITFAVALVIALLCIGIYFETFPETTEIEYVKPAPRQATDDLLDDGFSPDELGVVNSDSVDVESALDKDSDYVAQPTPDYQAKAEQIFRKNFEKEADRILSKIYDKSYLSNNEKRFLAENQETIRELMELQQKMGEEASLTAERAQLIASEIIERISNEKKKQLGGTNSRGIQLPEKK